MNRAQRRRQQKQAKRAAKNQKRDRPAAASDLQALLQEGLRAHQAGQLPDAEAAYRRVLGLDPNYAEAHYNLGNALKDLGRLEDAVASYQKALAIQPDFAEAHSNLGIALQDLGRLEEAVASYHKARDINPSFAKIHNNLGNALKDLVKFDDAVASYQKALAIQPDFAEAHSNLGIALKELGKLDDAVASYQKALAIQPDFAEAHNNLGTVLQDLGDSDEAVVSYRKAFSIKPDYVEAHKNLGIISLLLGDFETGWPEYSWRQLEDDSVLKIRAYSQPFWDGGNLTGKTLFVYPEQGLGDTIQFVRYLPMLRQRGGRVAFDVPLPMVRLLRDLDGVDVAFKSGDSLPPFDCHISLMELPRLLGTTLDTIPASGAYLYAEKDRIALWRSRIGGEGFRVGIAWQGNPSYKADRSRSIALRFFEPLSKIPGVRLISLQKHDGLDQFKDLPPDMTVETLGDDFDDGADAFIDTAAVMMGLDLIITSDTAVAHLAGALGAPVWTLLPFNPDWRWMLDRDDSPWYPSMRLFRQEKSKHWEGVIDRAAAELAGLVKDSP